MIRQLSFPCKPIAGKREVNVAINHKSCSIFQGRTSLGSRHQDLPGRRCPVEGESGCLQAAGELEEPLRNMEVVRKHLVRDISNSITWIGHISYHISKEATFTTFFDSIEVRTKYLL